ncbi:MAG: hypothetical protein ACTHKS_17270 [Gaiellaceae bacterium]
MNDSRPALDRLLAAIPYALAMLGFLALLFWQAAIRKSPTIFGDELEWTQISRAIADTGHAARRGEPVTFKSVYPYVIAPLWWIHSTSSAYAAIKYVNTVLMALAAVPTFLLARMLVPQRVAFVAALCTLCTTGLYYAPFLLPEVVAWPWFALCAYLTVRGLARGGRWWIVAAVAADLAAPLVRGELVVVPAAAAAAVVLEWLCSPTGSRARRRIGIAGQIAAVVLLAAAFFVLNEAYGGHSHEWATVTHQWKSRLWTLGMESTSALALGLGLLPFIGGLASLWLPGRRGDPAWRAFAAFAAPALLTTWLYTGVKAAYLSTVFATRVEERNMIYVQPLLIVGTAVWLCERRRSLAASLAAWAFATWLVVHYGYQLDFPYFEAPGYGIAAMANRAFHWDQPAIRHALIVCSALLLAVIVLAHVRRDGRVTRIVLVLAAAAAFAMMTAAEVTSSRGSAITSKTYAQNLPQPLDWVDQAAGGRGVTFVGQDISNGDALGYNLMEFWNRDVKHVWSLDGSAPGPGPTLTPDLHTRSGTLSNDPDQPLVLATDRVRLVGAVVAQRPGLTLQRVPHPWALHEASYGISTDGWIQGTSDDPVAHGTFAYFGPQTTKGVAHVNVGRAGFCGSDVASPHIQVRIGPVALNEQKAPFVSHPVAVRKLVVPNCQTRTITFTIAPPFAVQVSATPLVHPVDYNIGDNRYLGAQVGVSFTPR